MEDNIQHIFETIKDRQPDPSEEVVSCLTFPGVDFIFQISREETFDGEWIFRQYNLTLTHFNEIEELRYNYIRDLMMKAFRVYEDGDTFGLKIRIKDLLKSWTNVEFKIETPWRGTKDGANLKAED
jgi:hypothetical protein